MQYVASYSAEQILNLHRRIEMHKQYLFTKCQVFCVVMMQTVPKSNINMHIAMATNLSYHCELHVVLGIKPHQRSIREWTPYLSKY